MKATLLAVVVSLFIVPLTTHAQSTQADTEPVVNILQTANKINLNTADVDTLTQSFKGIGRKRAEAIVAYREANNGFKSIEDLALVKGIGKQFITRNRPQLQETYSLD